MSSDSGSSTGPLVSLRPVTSENWRAVCRVHVTVEQREFVMEASYYLALCHYDALWRPLAIYLGEHVIGFLMWAVSPEDRACWLGGIMIDRAYQGQGHGRSAVKQAIAELAGEHGYHDFALSYQPANSVAKALYASLGFVDTDEWEGDEVVARLSLPDEA
jgi:diamine N-acetyltransferase